MTKRDIRKLIRKVHTPFKNKDVLDIAKSLGVDIKASAECLEDFGLEKFPLNTYTGSVLATTKGIPTIYYNEKHLYANFIIAQMIVCYLAWYYIGEIPATDLMNYGAITMLVPKLALKNCTFSEADFSNKYHIPLQAVVEYFNTSREGLRTS